MSLLASGSTVQFGESHEPILSIGIHAIILASGSVLRARLSPHHDVPWRSTGAQKCYVAIVEEALRPPIQYLLNCTRGRQETLAPFMLSLGEPPAMLAPRVQRAISSDLSLCLSV